MFRPSSSELIDPIEAYRSRVERLIGLVGVVGVLLAVVVAMVVGWLLTALSGNAMVGLLLGAVVFVALAAWIIGRLRVWHGSSMLERLALRPIDEVSHPRVWNLVEGLCLRSGVEVPRVALVDDRHANALVLGGDPQQRCLVFTSGALEVFDRIELEAVVAWLVARLRSGEAQSSLRFAGMIGALPIRAGVADRMRRRVGIVDLVGAHDQAACALTRYPPGLTAALERARDTADESGGVVTPLWTLDEAHLWFIPPVEDRTTDFPGLDVSIEAALDERITTTRDL
jgi:uncharacterized membrane protein (DUF485 family)